MSGIDYGLGQANIDHKTGCRYGVIAINTLDPWIWEQLEAEYPDPEYDDDGNEIEWLDVEPLGHYLKTTEYAAHSAFDGTCLFLTSSEYYTFASFCSPCAPGAGDLNHPVEDGVKTLCFGHDMFEGNRAPYPVYRVKDGSLVEPPAE